MIPQADPLPAPQPRFVAPSPLQVVLYVLILLGCVLRVYNVIEHNPVDPAHLFSDPQRHWDHAKEPMTPSPMAIFDQPVFQIWLSVVQKFTLGIPALIAAYAAALSLLTPWCWYRFLRETLSSKTLALAGWAALALLPTWIGIYSYFMTETLFLPALGLSLWLTLRAKRRPTLTTFMTMVIVWTFCGLTRGIGLPLAAIAGLWVWIGHPRKIATIGYSLIFAVVVLTPLAVRNYTFVKLWAPHGNGWLNKIYVESGARVIQLHLSHNGAGWIYGFGSPSIDSLPFTPFSNWTSKRSGTIDVFIDFSNGAADWKAAHEKSAKHGAERWQLHVENIVFLLFGDSWPDNNAEYFIGAMANLSRWLWAPVLLGVIIFSTWQIKSVCSRPLVALVLGTTLFFQGWMLLVPNEGRYRKPLEGLLIAQVLVLADLSLARRKTKLAAQPTPFPTDTEIGLLS